MADSKYFNFSIFKSVMDVTDIDEPTYSFILKTIFSYLNKFYGINLSLTSVHTLDVTSTTSTLVIPYTTVPIIDQLVVGGAEEVYITDVVLDLTNNITTITISPSFTVLPATITIWETLVPFELQYAIYQHAKFLFDVQKKSLNVVESVTDSVSGRTTYKTKLPASIKAVYLEYSGNEIAFS